MIKMNIDTIDKETKQALIMTDQEVIVFAKGLIVLAKAANESQSLRQIVLEGKRLDDRKRTLEINIKPTKEQPIKELGFIAKH